MGREGGSVGGRKGYSGGRASPDGGGDGSSFSASATARGEAGAARDRRFPPCSIPSAPLGGNISRQGGGLVPSSPRGPLSRQATGDAGLGLTLSVVTQDNYPLSNFVSGGGRGGKRTSVASTAVGFVVHCW